MFWPVADRRNAAHLHRPVPFSLVRHALLFVCYFSAAHTFAQTPASDDQHKKISGTVVNAVTKAPIPRALVFSSDNRFAMLTDSEGHFEFTIPRDSSETGTIGAVISTHFHAGGCSSWLMARKPGFLDDCTETGAPSQSSDDNLTIVLVPEGIIYGRITLANSDAALSETNVELFFRQVIDGLPRWTTQKGMAQTNSAGEFRFAELHAGDYKLISHERADDDPIAGVSGKMYGYPPVFYPGAADFASAPTIHLSAGQSFQADLPAVRQQYYRVNIPVANDDLGSGMQVRVQAQAGPGFSLGYNPGTKRIEGFLPNGNYLVEGAVYGTAATSGTVNVKVNDAAVEGPAMTLVPDTSIRLDVKESFTDTTWNGSASWSVGNRTFTMRGPRVYLHASLESMDEFRQRGAGMRPPNRENDESLVLENVIPGRYWLRLSTGRGYVASARMGDIDLLRQPLVVTAGLSAPIEIEMRDDTAEIDGSVTNLPSSPAGAGSQSSDWSAWIYCVPLPESPGEFRDLVASQDGHFNYAMMAPGAYRILAFARPQNHLPYRDAEAMKAYETKGLVVHLSAGQKLNLQVPLIRDNDAPEK